MSRVLISVATIQEGGPTQNEIQEITVTATGGTWDLSWGPSPFTGELLAIAWNVSAAVLEQMIEGDVIDSGDTTVVTKAGGVYTVEYIGAFALTDIDQVTVDGSDLFGGDGPVLSAAHGLPVVSAFHARPSVSPLHPRPEIQ